MAALTPALRGRVDLAFLDPPYNAARERWVYPDRILSFRAPASSTAGAARRARTSGIRIANAATIASLPLAPLFVECDVVLPRAQDTSGPPVPDMAGKGFEGRMRSSKSGPTALTTAIKYA